MSRNSRKADPNQRRKILALTLVAACLAIVVIAGTLLFLEISRAKQLADRAKAESKATNAPAPPSPTREMPPLPEDPGALVNLGNAMLQRGLFPEATKIYLEAVKKKPDDEELRFNLGFAYTRQKMTNEAIHQYEESLRV